jgi:hypothetical protein
MFRPKTWFVVAILVYAIAVRILPYVLYNFGMQIDPARSIYPWNFSPLMALSLFGAAFYTDRRLAYLLPLAVLVISDVLIGLVAGDWSFAFHPTMPFVYGCTLFSVLLGMGLRERRTVLRVGATALTAEVVYFIVTNLGVWIMYDTYPHDVAGLIACYTAAIPFFGRSLASTAFFSAVFFSRLALTEVPAAVPHGADEHAIYEADPAVVG